MVQTVGVSATFVDLPCIPCIPPSAPAPYVTVSIATAEMMMCNTDISFNHLNDVLSKYGQHGAIKKITDQRLTKQFTINFHALLTWCKIFNIIFAYK